LIDWVAVSHSGIDLSVVKYGGGQAQSGEAIKLFQTPRRISFTFHFWHKSFILDYVKLAELSDNGFVRIDILGGQNILWPPPTYFSGIYAPRFSQCASDWLGRIVFEMTITMRW